MQNNDEAGSPRRAYHRPQLVKRDRLARVSGADGEVISVLGGGGGGGGGGG